MRKVRHYFYLLQLTCLIVTLVLDVLFVKRNGFDCVDLAIAHADDFSHYSESALANDSEDFEVVALHSLKHL